MIVFNPKPGSGGGAETVRNAKEYRKILEEEENTLKKELDSDWRDMEKMLTRTAKLDELRHLLAANQWLIPLLGDIGAPKKLLWMSYLALERETAADICEKYGRNRARLAEIVKEAESERPLWKDIVEEFMRRFDVPFGVQITNQAEALLGIKVPALKFTVSDQVPGPSFRRQMPPVT